MQYNAEQLRAIRHHTGRCLVVAGPGSGKTAVITERVTALIEERRVPPERILTLTFSKAAAIEMLARFTKRTASAYPAAVFGTFHSVFYRILRDLTGEAPRILTGQDRSRLMEQAMRSCGLYPSSESAAALLRAASLSKNRGDTAWKVYGSVPHAERFAAIMKAYEQMRGELALIDYDDIAADCLKRLRKDDEALARWQQRFAFLQVDEYQDIGPVQDELLHLLAAGCGNLLVVGDDDQSIYGFRGAKPEVMRLFLARYPDAAQITLPVNYRSEAPIIDAAQKVIRRNRSRLHKGAMRPAVTRKPSSAAACRYLSFDDAGAELLAICNALKARYPAGTRDADYSDTAVIVRTHVCAAAVAEKLSSEGILFDMKTAVRCVYEEAVAKDLLAYLRFAYGERTRALFLRIMNKPLRYFSRSSVRDALVEEATLLRYYADQPHMCTQVRRFFGEIRLLGAMRPHTAIGYLLQGVGYERYLRAENDREGFAYAMSVVGRMREDAEGKSADRYLAFVRDTLARQRENITAGTDAAARTRGVKLMTMHASKGLEFDHVYLPMCNAGILPDAHAESEEAIEEERRMLYVAMTRARKTLTVSCARRSKKGDLLPSPFLEVLQETPVPTL